VLRILLIAFAAVLALYLLKKFKRLEKSAKKKVWIESLFLVGAVVAVLVLARFGMHLLGLVIVAGWALLRGLAPHLLRLLPLIQRGRSNPPRSPAEGARSGGAGGGSPPRDERPRELMSRDEALEILGVQEGASRETILVAYRNLIRKVHPDSPGGSNYLASKLNQAKDVLLS
jgi:DnaJ homolog subfamily C member 19